MIPTPTHEFHPTFTPQEIFARDQRALAYLTGIDAARGHKDGTSALKPAPLTILSVPYLIPAAVLKHMVERVSITLEHITRNL
jgi:hypothetical protein